ALQRSHGLHCVGPADSLRARLGKPKVLHLALLDEIFHGSGNVFDRNIRIDTMLIEQIDDISSEPLERGFRNFLDVLWPAIQSGLFAGIRIKLESEFSSDRNLLAERS